MSKGFTTHNSVAPQRRPDDLILLEALGILHRFALEQTGWRGWLRRWYYSDEPTKSKACVLPETLERKGNEMKHTPGPWKITRCEDGLFMCHTDGDTICFGDPNHQEPDDSANFRLIAAAPDMHVALRQAKGALMWIIAYDSEDKCLARAIEAIETALAKAEGAEQ